MEQHEDDPIDDSAPDPWERLAGQFSSLGNKLKARYREMAGSEGPTEEEIRQAFRTLGGAWDRVVDAVSAALRDEEVRRTAKEAAGAFAAAIGAAWREIPPLLRREEAKNEGDTGEQAEAES